MPVVLAGSICIVTVQNSNLASASIKLEDIAVDSTAPVSQASRLLGLASTLYRTGQPTEAIQACREAYALQPERIDIWLLLGFMLSQGTERDEAEELLRRYVSAAPNNAVGLHTLGKIRQSKNDDIEAINWFERAIAISASDPPTWNDLGASLQRSGRFPEAIAAFSKATGLAPAWALPAYNLGTVYFDTERFDLAEAAYRQTLALDDGFSDAYSMLSATLAEVHRLDEAEVYALEYARRLPTVVRPCTGPRALARVLLIRAPSLCNIRTDFIFDNRRYDITYAFLPDDSEDARAAFLEALPPFDIVFNTIADPDRAGPFMQEAQALCEGIAQPVLNSPGEIFQRTRRNLLPAILSGIPHVAIPVTRRATVPDLTGIAETSTVFDPPLLVRPCGFHGGKHFVRIDHAEALSAYLKAAPHPAYYVTPYCDYQNEDGYFRKYRFIFVDRQIYPYHLAISRNWLVHYFRTDMAASAWMRAEEEKFLADYRQIFSGPLDNALQAVAKALDLDYAGIDCSIAQDGKLLVFEANAAMLAHLNDPIETFPYKHLYVPRIAQAMDQMIRGHL